MGLTCRAAVALVMVWLAAAPGCGEPCKLVRQTVSIGAIDPDLAAIADDCLRAQNIAWFRDAGARPDLSPRAAASDAGSDAGTEAVFRTQSIDETPAACLLVCRRVLTIVDTYPGEQRVMECWVGAGGYGNSATLSVRIGYRPPC